MSLFCPRCGSILKIEKEKNNVKYSCCCGFVENENNKIQYSLADKPKNKGLRVIDESKNRMAVHDHKCKKCGSEKAELIEKGQNYSDEDDVVLFKCGKCGFIEMMDAKVK